MSRLREESGMKKPIILVPSNDPNCVHDEYIIRHIGKCRKCGQVRDYSDNQDNRNFDDYIRNVTLTSNKKGGKAYVKVQRDDSNYR